MTGAKCSIWLAISPKYVQKRPINNETDVSLLSRSFFKMAVETKYLNVKR